MFELLLVLIGIIGFGYVGYKDLKTTEFPDWVPYAMIAGTLAIKFASSFLSGSYSAFTDSLLTGILLLGIGYILYFAGSWADGDAYVLGALGFLFPLSVDFLKPSYFLPLPLMLISNVFAIGGFYMIAYSFVLGARNLRVFVYLRSDLRRNSKKLLSAVFLIALFAFSSFYLMLKNIGINAFAGSLSLPTGFVVYFILLILLWRYVKIIDEKIFVRRIRASDLKYGDIPISAKLLRVPDPKLIRSLRAKGGYVKIKEGVRFTPVFLLAFLFTLFYGDALYLILISLA
ncbi:MAG: hypothetical protein V1836_02365 [Candidatus Aenigmatarchaeota archaeon]